MMRFHKMYVEAGGKVTAGGNTNVTKAVGLVLHQELEVFVEGGFTPMQAIQAATKWPAEAFHLQDRVGNHRSRQAGRSADRQRGPFAGYSQYTENRFGRLQWKSN